MRFHAGWQVYRQGWAPDVFEIDIENDTDLRKFLNDVKESRAEEVVFYPVNDSGDEIGERMEFQLNDSKTLAYMVFGLKESVGEADSPEEFTSSGGSFSAGTGVPVIDFETAVAEFFRTGKEPASIVWRNEIENIDELANENDNIPFRKTNS